MPASTSVCRLTAKLWHPTGAELGESPRWSQAQQRVHWIDINAGVCWSADIDGAHVAKLTLGAPLGAIAIGADTLAYAVGAKWQSLKNGAEKPMPWSASPAQGMRYNDCAVDALGRIWSATMRCDEVLDGLPQGCLYLCSRDASQQKIAGLLAGNALGWTPDGKHLYLVDSGSNRVLKMPFDLGNAHVGPQTCWLQCDEGLADGLAVDSQGGVWLALWGLGQVRRYSPEGRLDWIVDVPTPQVTALCFAGEDMRTVIITSAAMGLNRQTHNQAGHTYTVHSPVPGLEMALWNF